MIKDILFIGLTVVFLTPTVKGQVGINTNNPSANLDIISKDNASEKEVLNTSNTNSKYFKIYNKGNINFNSLLYLNSDSGTSNYVLSSQGPNTLPIWKEISKTSLNDYVTIAYNGSKDTQTPNQYYDGNQSANISFSGSININSDEVGTWNTDKTIYTVKKAGIYEVIVAVKCHTTANQSNRSGVMAIFVSSYPQYFAGSNIVGDNFITYFNGKITRYMEEGATIQVAASLNSQWRYDKAFVNINYSAKTN